MKFFQLCVDRNIGTDSSKNACLAFSLNNVRFSSDTKILLLIIAHFEFSIYVSLSLSKFH